MTLFKHSNAVLRAKAHPRYVFATAKGIDTSNYEVIKAALAEIFEDRTSIEVVDDTT